MTMSFHAGRTTGEAVPSDAARNWSATIGVSLAHVRCRRDPVEPESPRISVAAALDRLLQRPTCGWPLFSLCLNLLTGNSMCWAL